MDYGVRVVVAHVRTRVALGDAEIGEQQGHRLGLHRGAAVGVEHQRPGSDSLLFDGVGDQPPGQLCRLAMGDHPTHHVAAVDVEDDVEVVVGPLRGAEQLGDVPAPSLVGSGGQELGLALLPAPQGWGLDATHCRDAIDRAIE